MGWSGTYIGKGRPKGISDLDFFNTRVGSNETGRRRVIASNSTRETFFAATEVLNDTDFLPEGTVFANIILKQYHRTEQGVEFLWNDLWEGMTDLPTGANAAVLNALTDTENELALTWRAANRALIAQPGAKFGDVISLVTPMVFSDGVTRGRFEVVRNGGLVGVEDGRPVKLKNWRAKEYTIEVLPDTPEYSIELLDGEFADRLF